MASSINRRLCVVVRVMSARNEAETLANVIGGVNATEANFAKASHAVGAESGPSDLPRS